MIERNGVRCGLQADCVVVTVLVGLEAAATVILWLLRGLSVIQAVGLTSSVMSAHSRGLLVLPAHCIMPDVHSRAFQWLAIVTMDVSEQVCVGCTFFYLSDDRCAVWLDWHTCAIEWSKNC